MPLRDTGHALNLQLKLSNLLHHFKHILLLAIFCLLSLKTKNVGVLIIFFLFLFSALLIQLN